MTLRLKYAQVPVIAAIEGLALGGGCEIAMHCARTVAALETRIGLVESSVGLIPGGGGCKELALRIGRLAAESSLETMVSLLRPAHRRIARAETARNGLEAKQKGFLREADGVVFHPAELLYAAKQAVAALQTCGYQPAIPGRGVRVAGRAGLAMGEESSEDMSEQDRLIARAAALALCGGDVEAGTLVDESWLLDVERAAFMSLASTEKTQQRIAHMLKHGKPLRN
jgi:3-hydroxyacyl-CoA dehydrogenase